VEHTLLLETMFDFCSIEDIFSKLLGKVLPKIAYIATTFLFVECVVAKYLRKKRDTDLLFNLSGYYRS